MKAKKKERIGRFRYRGREWQPLVFPQDVSSDKDLGKPFLDGVSDQTINASCVSGDVDPDSDQFAVETHRRWSSVERQTQPPG